MYRVSFAILAVTAIICSPAGAAEKDDCGVNEAKYPCGQRCELRCNKAPLPGLCKGLRCQPPFACRCKNGYARDYDSNRCVAIDKCPVNECGVGEIKGACGTTCEGTCESQREPEKCARIRCDNVDCRCDLKGGWVRNLAGECVRMEDCKTEI